MLKSALFIDFDNVYSSLYDTNPAAAKLFATEPGKWIDWLEKMDGEAFLARQLADFALESDSGEDEAPAPAIIRRRLLVRKCYLNPVPFSHYRGYYSRAGFSVVDCPPLTKNGKNAADIHMVLDIVDALRHDTRFDEFIVLSADADFTPVMLRLRAHDRRTVMLANRQAAQAYRAACDLVIDIDSFIEEAIDAPEPHNQAMPAYAPSYQPAARRGYDECIRSFADLLLKRLQTWKNVLTLDEMLAIAKSMPEFADSYWFGCRTLTALMERLHQHQPALTANFDADGKMVSVALNDATASAETATDWTPKIISMIENTVRNSLRPVPMARLSSDAIQLTGNLARATGWFGYNTFRSFVEAHVSADFTIISLHGGLLAHRTLHAQQLAEAPPQQTAGMPAELERIVATVVQITGAPRMTPDAYGEVYRAIGESITQAPYNLTETGKHVRDLCALHGWSIPRHTVNFVLTGVRYGGLDLAERPDATPNDIAAAFLGNIEDACEAAQITLSDEEQALLRQWLHPHAAPADAVADATTEDETPNDETPNDGPTAPLQLCGASVEQD